MLHTSQQHTNGPSVHTSPWPQQPVNAPSLYTSSRPQQPVDRPAIYTSSWLQQHKNRLSVHTSPWSRQPVNHLSVALGRWKLMVQNVKVILNYKTKNNAFLHKDNTPADLSGILHRNLVSCASLKLCHGSRVFLTVVFILYTMDCTGMFHPLKYWFHQINLVLLRVPWWLVI